MSYITIINNFQSEQTVDLLNPKLHKIFDYVTYYANYTYRNHEKVVNISYNSYGTTSLWWLILLASGQIHPYEILPGTNLLLPSLPQVAAGINAMNPTTKSVAKVVSI